ncbi:MAG: phage holin family protein [Bacteroidales bacterium]|nr:phage holin family protein [Bacteroidales bacterium]
MTFDNSSTISTLAQGGVAVTALAFLHTALMNMIPYFICAIPLIVLDCKFGIRAARYRNEKVTFSRAFRRTMSKCADYICWVVIAASIALAFEAKFLEWLILGAVMGNEIISIIGNYFETKGLELSWVNLYRWIFKAGAEKVGASMDTAEAEGIIKPKRERDPKTGRYIKKQ